MLQQKTIEQQTDLDKALACIESKKGEMLETQKSFDAVKSDFLDQLHEKDREIGKLKEEEKKAKIKISEMEG